ncbi:MAG: GrpB family protein, partial [Lachnospiraceae bacterium]|nr:GrpB family protein [Lachnospiraceae bacterium]
MMQFVIWNQREWTNYINFRDYLNSNDEMALKYSMMKEELSKWYMNDR